MVMVNLTIAEIDAIDSCIELVGEQMDCADHELEHVQKLAEEIELAKSVYNQKLLPARHQKRMAKKRRKYLSTWRSA